MIWSIDPARFKGYLIWAVAVAALVFGLFAAGYWSALSHVAKDVKAQTEQSQKLNQQAAQAAEAAQQAHAAGDAAAPKLAADTKRLAKAKAAVAALKLPENLPDIPANRPIIVLQEAEKAHEAVEDDLRKQLALKTMEAESWKTAYEKECLSRLSLEGVIAANKANEQKAIFKAEFKGFTIGVPVGAAIAIALHK